MLVEEPKPESYVGFLLTYLLVSMRIIGCCSLKCKLGVLDEVILKLSLFMLDIKLAGDRLRCIKLVVVIKFEEPFVLWSANIF